MVALPRRTYVVVYFAYRNAEGLHLDPFGNKFMICTSAKKGRGKYSALAEWMVINFGWVASRINYPSQRYSFGMASAVARCHRCFRAKAAAIFLWFWYGSVVGSELTG